MLIKRRKNVDQVYNFSTALMLSEKRHSSMSDQLLEAMLFVAYTRPSVIKSMVIDILNKKNA